MIHQLRCLLEIKFGLIALMSCLSGAFCVSAVLHGTYEYISECYRKDTIMKWTKDTFASRYDRSRNNVQDESCSKISDISIGRSPQRQKDFKQHFDNFYKECNVIKLRQAHTIPITIVSS